MNRVRMCAGAWAVLWVCAACGQAQQAASQPASSTQPASSPRSVESAQATFNSIFGADIKKATASSDPRDDIELGGQMLRSAQETKDADDLLTLLCENACTLLSKHPSGQAGAVQAMELLAARVPAKRPACLDKILVIRQKQYQAALGAKRVDAGEDLLGACLQVVEAKASGDQYDDAIKVARTALATIGTLSSEQRADLQARIKALGEAEKTQQIVQQLKERIKTNPADEAARSRIVQIYLAELDKPAEAAKFLTPDSDETLRTYVPLAALDADTQPEQVCMELGDWYRGLAEPATMPGKALLLRRAKGYYEAFLAKHPGEDLARTKAALTLDKVQKDLEKLGPSAAPAWVDVLRLADAAKPLEGQWHRQGRQVGITGGRERSHLAIPVVPNGSYEMTATFARQSDRRADRGSVMIHVPVADGRLTFTLSASQDVPSGIAAARPSPVRVPGFSMENRRQYTFAARVTVSKTSAEITTTVNGRKFADWKGIPADLPKHDEFGAKYAHCLIIGAQRNEVVFDSVKVKMTSGSLDRLRDGASGEQAQPSPGKEAPPKDAPPKDHPPRNRDKPRPPEPPAPAPAAPPAPPPER